MSSVNGMSVSVDPVSKKTIINSKEIINCAEVGCNKFTAQHQEGHAIWSRLSL